MTAVHEALVEKVARAICEATSGPYELMGPHGKDACREEARSAIALIYAEIRAVTPEMVDAWGEAFPDEDTANMDDDAACRIHAQVNWGDMLSASPLNPGGE